jgi:hypothetical protein
MHVILLNAQDASGALDGYLGDLASALHQAGHTATEIRLRDLRLHACIGCFGCWLKHPGVCTFQDDGVDLCREVIASDVTVFATPVVMGFAGELARRAGERFIPLLLPYLELVEGECHHRRRYDRYPALALLLDPAADTDAEDRTILERAYARLALNFQSTLRCTRTVQDPVEEVRDALARA